MSEILKSRYAREQQLREKLQQMERDKLDYKRELALKEGEIIELKRIIAQIENQIHNSNTNLDISTLPHYSVLVLESKVKT